MDTLMIDNKVSTPETNITVSAVDNFASEALNC